MNPITGTQRGRIPLGVAIALALSLAGAGAAWAYYPPDGTKPDGAGGYMNPNDGMCVIGVALDGTLLVDWSITNARDCVAWTEAADGSNDLSSMDTSDKCTKTANPDNDGYRHAWSTSLCYDVANSKGLSRIDLDNTDSMCFSKGGTVVTTGKCVAYGWVYRNRKADNSLPVTGTGVNTTDGVLFADGLGFCYTQMRMTSATYTSSTTCPSLHNSAATAPPGEWVPFGPGCLSSTSGCQTQASYDAGLGWSWDSTNSRCLYAYGVTGLINSAATKADGTTYTAGSTQDLTLYTNQGDCLANGFSWDNWLPNTSTTTVDNTDPAYAGLPAGAVIRRLDALSSVEDGGGDFYSGTGAVCQKCHSDQSRSYQERQKPGFPKTRHKLAGDAVGQPFQPNFTEAGSDWGLQGVQCAMCHSTAKPAQDDLIQVVPLGVAGPPAAGAPKSASGHNQTEYGTHLIDLCFHCHGTATTPSTDNPASVIPVGPSGFALTSKGLQPIANQFLNSPHAEYIGDSKKENIGAKTNYESSFEGYVCRTASGKLSSTTYPNSGACTGAGYTWYTTTSNGNFCYYDATSCVALPTGEWTTSFAAAAYPWAADTGGPGGVCKGVGIGSIITTVYRNGFAQKIHNLDSTTNEACTNAGTGLADSGAAGFWVKDGETVPGVSPGYPTDTAQGNCMTCHDVHWALADTDPEAEPLRRECTSCHANVATSASGAPQIDLATINHLAGVGTPLENMATHPSEACEVCHMPRSSATGSPMHLWRINTDSAYHTMGASKANTSPDGDYAEAAWVDLDHACGQCHGGSGAAQPGVPYFTTAQLAQVAKGMHGSADVNYIVNFSTWIDPGNSLKVNVEAGVDCGGTCPPLTYDWNWGDSTAHGSASPDTHTYGASGTYVVTLVVKENGQEVGTSIRNVKVIATDLPPVVGGTCTWFANTWTMQLVDSSTDDKPNLKVVVDWGDGGTKSNVAPGGTVSKTYGKIGTFLVIQKAIDSKPQASTGVCGTATPGYFTISGTVYASNGTTPVAGAYIVLKKGALTVKTALTAANGTYVLSSLKPGTYSITVSKSGQVFAIPAILSVTVGPNQANQDINAQVPTALGVLPTTTPRGVRSSSRSVAASSGDR